MYIHYSSKNFQVYSYLVAFHKIFYLSHNRFDGHNITAILREQGSLPLGFADPHMDRDHAPAICHKSRYGFQVAALFRWNGNEVPRGWTLPEPNLTVERNVHRYSISN